PVRVTARREGAEVEQARQVAEQAVEDHLDPERAVRAGAAADEQSARVEWAHRQSRAECGGARREPERVRPCPGDLPRLVSGDDCGIPGQGPRAVAALEAEVREGAVGVGVSPA